ncbi:MAG: helix-turn-helix domain-containing protein [Rhizobiales bacterium]|nr:helix-turn-helix domain-containing protein [Hyphomicrobiales bacterium]
MSDNLKQRIGARVKAARTLKGLSQPQLGEAINKAWETVSNIERGKTAPNFSTLYDISLSLGVPMRDFFDFEDPFGAAISDERQITLIETGLLANTMSDEQLLLWLKIGKVLEEHSEAKPTGKK